MDGIALIAAIIALFVALGARSRIAALQAQLSGARDELRALQAQIARAPRAPMEAEPAEAATAGAFAGIETIAQERTDAPAAPVADRAHAAEEKAEETAEAVSTAAIAEPAAAEPGTAEPGIADAATDAGALPEPPPLTAAPAMAAERASSAPEPAAERPRIAAATAAVSLEERLGARWAVWVGGAALALGGILLVRYSIEQGIFGPAVRVALGAVFSLVLVVAGEWFRRSERTSPAEAVPSAHIPGILTAAGTVSAFGTAYAAHALYQYIGPAAAFVLLGAIALTTMLAAALHGPALAGLGLAGALVVPMLIASQDPNPWPLVLYLAVVAAAAHALARVRRWPWLAAAAVAGALVWGFALVAQVSAGAPGAWPLALFVHVGLQLALAALFMALVPHWDAGDAEAAPDRIATLALAVLTGLAVLALDATRTQEHWAIFATVAVAILSLTAWCIVPVAGASALAGLLALAAMAVWPGLLSVSMTPPPAPLFVMRLPYRPAALIETSLGLPDDVPGFLTFAALATLLAGVPATWRLWRSPTLSPATTGLYALAGAVATLLALVLAYLRVTQFGRSVPFALCAVALAAAFGLIAYGFARRASAESAPAAGLRIGAFGSAAAAAAALALVMLLDRGYLTVAFAIAAYATARFAVAGRVQLLRYAVVALGLVVLGRLVWDPRIMGPDLGTWPVLNWLLLGYGVPAVAFLAAGRLLGREAQDAAARLCDALGVLFAALLVFFQIRHALNGGDPLARTSGHVEQGLFALMSIGFAAVLIRMDVARGNPVFRAAALTFGVLSAGVTVIGLGVAENPLFTGEPVHGRIIASTLVLAYLLPGLAAIVLARIARGVRPEWYVNGATGLAVALLFGYVALELRHAFHGESLGYWLGASAPEAGAITLASLAFAAVLVHLDATRVDPALRWGSLILGGLAAVLAVLGLGLAENPLVGELVRGPVPIDTLVPAYLLPGLGALALARIAHGVRSPWYVDRATELGLALLFGYVALEVRHAFHGENLVVWRGTTAAEVGLLTLASLAFAAALVRIDVAWPYPALRRGSLVFGGLAAAAAILVLGIDQNPLFEADPVSGPVVFSSLMPAYLAPAAGAVVLARTARGVRPEWYAGGAAALGLLLIFGYVSLEVRHAFQGESLSVAWGASAPEVWSYSVAWLALGLAFLFYGVWRGSVEPRLASAALVVLSVLKVFLYDLTGIGGFWRAFSMICLGAVLIGIGLMYQKLVFARPNAPPGP
jgi:uncharacterized membrane protein